MNKRRLLKILVLALSIFCAYDSHATELVVRLVEYNKDTQEFILAYSGQKPSNSYVYFDSKYGATTGNRYNQIPRNQEVTFTLAGWQHCSINSITFNMCSNRSSGTVGFSVQNGDETLYTMKPVEFADEAWYGQWVAKDYGVYVDVTKELNLSTFTEDYSTLKIKGGTSEGSVYINSITIDYTATKSTTLESPLGWKFEKLDAKSSIGDGDVVMIYRNGSAAADYDGMEKSHYLDVVGLKSTTDVNDPDVKLFTLNKAEDGTSWTLTDQCKQKLGATKIQSLAWDEGVTTWNVKLGRDGAEIASTNDNYGLIKYNAPEGSYARFWNYKASSSLPLPYLYRRVGQLDPVQCTEISLDETEKTVDLSEGTLAFKVAIKPATTTDVRVDWSSSDDTVATVQNGFVTLLAVGETTLTARSHDGGAEATVKLTVVDEATGMHVNNTQAETVSRKVAAGNAVKIVSGNKSYTVDGKLLY